MNSNITSKKDLVLLINLIKIKNSGKSFSNQYYHTYST